MHNKLEGTTLGEVESIELEYKNGLDMVYALGNVEPAFNSIAGGSEVSGKIELYLDSTSITKFTNYINKTDQSVVLVATGTAIGSAANYGLNIDINRTTNTAGIIKITDDANLLSLEFEGMKNVGLGSLLAVTLTNLISSAY